ncbi:MAG: Na(+)/H(+) antiporter subunit B [Planctomycetota bacterium]
MREQIVPRVVGKMLIPYVLLFGPYVITHGELGPGGGFQGGVILGSAVILHALIFGVRESRKALPRGAIDVLLGLGILLYAGVGVLGLLLGGSFLDYSVLVKSNPAAAEALGMTLVEYGVGITVAAVMITLFNKIAGER